jgi:hypothetical protein
MVPPVKKSTTFFSLVAIAQYSLEGSPIGCHPLRIS